MSISSLGISILVLTLSHAFFILSGCLLSHCFLAALDDELSSLYIPAILLHSFFRSDSNSCKRVSIAVCERFCLLVFLPEEAFVVVGKLVVFEENLFPAC